MRAITGVMEDYLKVIYKLQQALGSATTSAVAGRMGVSAASATSMIKRLARQHLVVHTPYRGLVLTPQGRRIALETIRRHRLLELYLCRHLGVSLDQVDREAERMEHALSPEVEARIAERLGHPTRDPHGDPIPDEDGTVRDVRYPSLVEIPPGEGGVVDRVSDRRPEALRRLASLGMLPGTSVRVVAHLSGRRVRVDLDGQERVLPRVLAQGVYVR